MAVTISTAEHYIDIHRHQAIGAAPNVLTIYNTIIGQNDVSADYTSAGIHPWYIDDDVELQYHALASLLATERILAVGECGLDKMRGQPIEQQVAVFDRQIQFAQEFKRPLLIHCVRAYAEVEQSIRKSKFSYPVIFHGFNKNETLAHQLLRNGFYISLGASILKGTQDALVRSIPLDRIFFETDDSPVSIAHIYAYFCSVRGISQVHLKREIYQNFNRIFTL